MDDISWSEWLRTPVDIAQSAASSIQHSLRQPWHIGVCVDAPSSDQPVLVITTGPWWLCLATLLLEGADVLTGHYWCNHDPFGGAGLYLRSEDLMQRYGTDARISMTVDQKRELYRALDWTDWPAEDDDDHTPVALAAAEERRQQYVRLEPSRLNPALNEIEQPRDEPPPKS